MPWSWSGAWARVCLRWLRSIKPPSDASLSRISIGLPGAHVVYSTDLFLSSQVLALIFLGLPRSLSTGLPSVPLGATIPRRASTLLAGQNSREGVKT